MWIIGQTVREVKRRGSQRASFDLSCPYNCITPLFDKFFFFKYYLSLLRLLQQNIISPSYRGWEIEDEFSSWWRISFWLSTTFLLCSQMVLHVCACTHTHKHTQKQRERDSLVFSLVQFSHSVVSDSLQPHGLQHARLPCPSPTPGTYSNSSPPSRWCHPTSSSSVVPFSSCLQSFPTSGSFPMSQFFASDGQSIGVSASASVLPMNIQDFSYKNANPI